MTGALAIPFEQSPSGYRQSRVATVVDLMDTNTTFQLDPSGTLFGRAPSRRRAVVTFADRAAVSREHCLIRHTGMRWELIDLGSTNGTFVNYRAVRPNEAIALEDDDVVMLGYTDAGAAFRFALHDQDSALKHLLGRIPHALLRSLLGITLSLAIHGTAGAATTHMNAVHTLSLGHPNAVAGIPAAASSLRSA